jgi:hypothetical protein
MNTLAALMVLVACHPEQTNCLEEPVVVISYDSSAECRAALPREMDKARRLADLIYGDCVPVDADLLAGRQIHQTIDPVKLSALDLPQSGAVTAKAFADPHSQGRMRFSRHEGAK